METTTVWIIYTQIMTTIKLTCTVNSVRKIHEYDTRQNPRPAVDKLAVISSFSLLHTCIARKVTSCHQQHHAQYSTKAAKKHWIVATSLRATANKSRDHRPTMCWLHCNWITARQAFFLPLPGPTYLREWEHHGALAPRHVTAMPLNFSQDELNFDKTATLVPAIQHLYSNNLIYYNERVRTLL